MTHEYEQMIHCLFLDVSMCLGGRIYYGPSCPFKLARKIFIVFLGVHMGNVVLAEINTTKKCRNAFDFIAYCHGLDPIKP
jgi:hypothetical protein